MERIYLDNAASRMPTKRALQTYAEYSERYYANTAANHALGIEASAELEAMRERISKCINGSNGRVYFCSGGTEANNLTILGVMSLQAREGKTGILTTKLEHSSVLRPIYSLREQNIAADFVSSRRSGTVNPKDIKMQISANLGLVSVMYANNVTGVIQPIAAIGEMCKANGVLFHADGVQAMGHTDIDVERDNVDLLSFSAHKFGGVKGVGGLWVRDGVKLLPLLHGGGQESGLRSGTVDLPGVAAMAVALEESLAELPEVYERCRKYKRILLQTLREHNVLCTEIGDSKKLPHILCIAFEGINAGTLQLLLSDSGVMVSTGSACSSISGEGNYVLEVIGVPSSLVNGAIRLSFSGSERYRDVWCAACRIASAVKALSRQK